MDYQNIPWDAISAKLKNEADDLQLKQLKRKTAKNQPHQHQQRDGTFSKMTLLFHVVVRSSFFCAMAARPNAAAPG